MSILSLQQTDAVWKPLRQRWCYRAPNLSNSSWMESDKFTALSKRMSCPADSTPQRPHNWGMNSGTPEGTACTLSSHGLSKLQCSMTGQVPCQAAFHFTPSLRISIIMGLDGTIRRLCHKRERWGEKNSLHSWRGRVVFFKIYLYH